MSNHLCKYVSKRDNGQNLNSEYDLINFLKVPYVGHFPRGFSGKPKFVYPSKNPNPVRITHCVFVRDKINSKSISVESINYYESPSKTSIFMWGDEDTFDYVDPSEEYVFYPQISFNLFMKILMGVLYSQSFSVKKGKAVSVFTNKTYE